MESICFPLIFIIRFFFYHFQNERKFVMINEYIKIKNKFNDCVVLIKSGIFYYTYDKDSLMLSFIMGYKRNNNRVGFPINKLEKVLSILSNLRINVYVDDMLFEYGNMYNIYLDKVNFDNKVKDLLRLIENKINKDNSIYNKLILFMGEIDE